jgi:hypothetical protein
MGKSELVIFFSIYVHFIEQWAQLRLEIFQ